MNKQKGFSLLAVVLIIAGVVVVVGGGVLAYQYYNSNKNPNPNPVVGCTPNWTCDWGECINGYQSQVAKDLNNCGQPSSTAQTACTALAKACGNTTQPSITVTAPNGGEQLRVGQSFNITWSSSGLTSGKKLAIYLERKGPGDTQYWNIATIAQNLPQNGSYAWAPNLQTIDANYKILISEMGSSGLEKSDESNNPFNIGTSSAQPSITVTSPNGGEVWKVGETHTISWRVTGNAYYGNVVLLKGGDFFQMITDGKVQISNTFNWTIPNQTCGGDGCSPFQPGNDYQIRALIYDSNDSKAAIFSDVSDNYFTITQ